MPNHHFCTGKKLRVVYVRPLKEANIVNARKLHKRAYWHSNTWYFLNKEELLNLGTKSSSVYVGLFSCKESDILGSNVEDMIWEGK